MNKRDTTVYGLPQQTHSNILKDLAQNVAEYIQGKVSQATNSNSNSGTDSDKKKNDSANKSSARKSKRGKRD